MLSKVVAESKTWTPTTSGFPRVLLVHDLSCQPVAGASTSGAELKGCHKHSRTCKVRKCGAGALLGKGYLYGRMWGCQDRTRSLLGPQVCLCSRMDRGQGHKSMQLHFEQAGC